MKSTLFTKLSLLTMILTTGSAFSAPNEALRHAQSNWERCNYGDWSAASARNQCFEKTIAQINADLTTVTNTDELKVWLAINKASLAGSEGGLTGLRYAKEAKAIFEEIIKTNPYVLEGSAYTSLGTLYYKVPGWPVGFGDNKLAESYLKQGLNANPEGIDSNFFYADYLVETGKKSEAMRYLEKALAAPARSGRETADEGRRKEISALMDKIKN